jgi:hypothetical protein
MIRRFFSRREAAATVKAAGPATRRSRRRRPDLESLEGRTLLSLIGSERQLAAGSALDNASSANGTSVAIYSNTNGLIAQRFDKYGHATGAAITVTSANTFGTGTVAMDATGRFDVAWQATNADGTSTIMMRYYNANGTPATGITQVGPSEAYDYTPDVAASSGSLVVTWYQWDGPGATAYEIDAERYVISGGVPTSPTPILVATGNVGNSSVAMASSGKFDIVYEQQGTGAGIYGSQYSSTGALVHGGVLINSNATGGLPPSIAMDSAGNAVVAYAANYNGSTTGVYATRWSSKNVLSAPITVYDPNNGLNYVNGDVALEAVGGQFVVTWGSIGGSGLTEVDSNNSVLATLGLPNGGGGPISIDGYDRYFISYSAYDASTGHTEIFSYRDFLS